MTVLASRVCECMGLGEPVLRAVTPSARTNFTDRS